MTGKSLTRSVAELLSMNARCERLDDLLAELFAAERAYGCGFYDEPRWLAAYNELAREVNVSREQEDA